MHSIDRPHLADTWYSLSYLYLSVVGTLTTIVCGLLVSVITGKQLLAQQRPVETRLWNTVQDELLSSFRRVQAEEAQLWSVCEEERPDLLQPERKVRGTVTFFVNVNDGYTMCEREMLFVFCRLSRWRRKYHQTLKREPTTQRLWTTTWRAKTPLSPNYNSSWKTSINVLLEVLHMIYFFFSYYCWYYCCHMELIVCP